MGKKNGVKKTHFRQRLAQDCETIAQLFFSKKTASLFFAWVATSTFVAQRIPATWFSSISTTSEKPVFDKRIFSFTVPLVLGGRKKERKKERKKGKKKEKKKKKKKKKKKS